MRRSKVKKQIKQTADKVKSFSFGGSWWKSGFMEISAVWKTRQSECSVVFSYHQTKWCFHLDHLCYGIAAYFPQNACADLSYSYLYADYLSGQWELGDGSVPSEIKGGVLKTASKLKESKHLQKSGGGRPPRLISKPYIRSNYAQASPPIHTWSF